MECDLTYASDKFIALSGIAEEFQTMNNDVYLAGLWKVCFFTDQLLWCVKHTNTQLNGQPSARLSIYRAPSWSWLSIDAETSRPHISLIFESSLIEVIHANVELVNDSQPTEQVKQDAIFIHGHLKRTKLQKKPKKKPNERAAFYTYDGDNNRMGLMAVYFDEAAIRPTWVFCMPTRFSFSDTMQDSLEGLLLVPTGEKPLEFKRVGHFRSDDVETNGNLVTERDGDKIKFTIV